MPLTNTKLTKSLFLTGFLMLASLTLSSLFNTGSAHAASITVATGNDETTVNSNCSLSEAITNINAGNATAYPECTGTGVFGTDDTISLPSGTITLTDNLPPISQPITIYGQGMGQSIVDADYNTGFNADQADSLIMSGLTIKGFKDFAIISRFANVTLNQIELDGNGQTMVRNSSAFGIQLINDGNGLDLTNNVSNIYIHDIDADAPQFFPFAISLAADGTTYSNQISNVAVSNVSNTGTLVGITFNSGYFGNASGTLNATVQNITVTGLSSSTDQAQSLGTAVVMIEGSSHSTVNVNLDNATIIGMNSQDASTVPGFEGTALGVMGAAITAGSVADVNLVARNVIVADNTSSDTSANCKSADLAPLFGGGAGTTNLSFTSQGGNFSDDTTCSSFFAQSTDHNNIGSLTSTLGTLSDNGGFVPTMPLLAGSPAIDAGVTVSGLTTDARLATRPQGNAYDSGAYESPYTKAVADSEESLAGTGERVGLYLAAAVAVISVGVGVFILSTKKR